jgi:hypothetical protein
MRLIGADGAFPSQGAQGTADSSSSTMARADARRRLRDRAADSADYAYTCEPTGTGTRVLLRADCVTSGAWVFVGGMIRGAIPKADSGQLESFKRVVEAGARDA